MDGIAVYMALNELPNQISRDAFGRAISKLFDRMPRMQSSTIDGEPVTEPLVDRLEGLDDPLLHVQTEVRSCGLLVDDPAQSGTLRFAHKSFLEFLAGKAAAWLLLEERLEIVRATLPSSETNYEHLLSSFETTSFFAEIVYGSRQWNRDSKSLSAKSIDLPRWLFGKIVSKTLAARWLAHMLLVFSKRRYHLIVT